MIYLMVTSFQVTDKKSPNPVRSLNVLFIPPLPPLQPPTHDHSDVSATGYVRRIACLLAYLSGKDYLCKIPDRILQTVIYSVPC
jgi:hypothetical protein